MKVLKMCCIAAVAIGLTPAALADKYDDLAAKGYRWVTVDGPYGSPSRDDLRQIVKGRTEGKELEFIEQLRAYYLIPGTVVQVIRKDAASGMSQIQLDGVRRPLWTLTRFLSTRPITDVYGQIEDPFQAGTTLSKPIGTGENRQQLGATAMPSGIALSGSERLH